MLLYVYNLHSNIIMYVGFSQELTSNCESSFGVQTVEYIEYPISSSTPIMYLTVQISLPVLFE